MAPVSHEQLKNRVEVAVNLAKLEGKVDTGFSNLQGDIKLLHTKMDSILELRNDVKEHGKQIARWQGVSAVIGAIGIVLAGWYAKAHNFFLG